MHDEKQQWTQAKSKAQKIKKEEEMKSKHKQTMKAPNDIEYTTHKGQY